MNRRATIAKIRELLDVLERDEEPAGEPLEEPAPKPVKPTRRGFENLERAYRRNGVYPPGAWKK